MLWFVLFLSLCLLDTILLVKKYFAYKYKKKEKKKKEKKNIWPHKFRIMEKRKDSGKPYFIVLRRRDGEWGIVGRYIAENKVTMYYNITASVIPSKYSLDKSEWDSKEEAQEIANLYCEYHVNANYEEIVGEFTVK